jgi:hypothetical protein
MDSALGSSDPWVRLVEYGNGDIAAKIGLSETCVAALMRLMNDTTARDYVESVLRPVLVGRGRVRIRIRVRIRFFFRRHMADAVTEQMKTASGYIPLSMPEMTAFDLVRYRKGAGSIDHIATVLAELAERLDARWSCPERHHEDGSARAQEPRGRHRARSEVARARQHDDRGGGVIPADFIAEWRAHTRWETNEEVAQDLVLSRALVAIFQDSELASALAPRGGIALHKLFFSPARRHSNDIDLVPLAPGPFGPTTDRLRAQLDGWLGYRRCRRVVAATRRLQVRSTRSAARSPPGD